MHIGEPMSTQQGDLALITNLLDVRVVAVLVSVLLALLGDLSEYTSSLNYPDQLEKTVVATFYKLKRRQAALMGVIARGAAIPNSQQANPNTSVPPSSTEDGDKV